MRTVSGFALAALVLGGCTATQEAKLKETAPRSGLVDYSRMTAGTGQQAQLRWIDPDARWTKYKAVFITPVSYWADPDGGAISGEDQQLLTNYMYQALQQQFAQKVQVVDHPGADVIKIQIAIVDANAATPGLRTVSMLIPQARVLATLKYAATGTYPFVGGAQVEGRAADSHTGRILGEWADRRLGSGSMEAAAQWQWGDAENAMNKWAAESATKLAAWMAGTAKP